MLEVLFLINAAWRRTCGGSVWVVKETELSGDYPALHSETDQCTEGFWEIWGAGERLASASLCKHHL